MTLKLRSAMCCIEISKGARYFTRLLSLALYCLLHLFSLTRGSNAWYLVYNQSRICGKGVGLGLFPTDSLQSQSYEFIEIAHIEPYYGVEMTVEIFVRIVWTVFEKIEKWRFLAIFGNFGYVSHIPVIRF